MTLRLDPNLADPDGFYAAIVRANDGLSEDQSQNFALRLVFLLANQISDAAVLEACVAEAAKPYTGASPQ
ncbi:Protein of unknown function [Rhizobiales bacterium GAS191]|nr:Protein of unknown function [Rhizobiales bacterium GAS113]SEB87108.1 Protein of unknown function [Rhizobiales bacterium GAS188]SED37189.1 Protein of unknown function [Rhizobiales bacterium GAS191]